MRPKRSKNGNGADTGDAEAGDAKAVITHSRFRHDSRTNNPPAGLAADGEEPLARPRQYAYNPHLPPVLRFDAGDQADKLLAKAVTQPLTADEVAWLHSALRDQQPWLEWAGKREAGDSFTTDPVSLHIHERVAPQAMLRAAARQDVERTLFADPQLPYHEAVQFYKHKIGWTNRLILGDNLTVMASLTAREVLAGQVQMIYMDPPYGIKFASNFQPEIGRRDVKESDDDLTREPEMVKAFRDTWNLGIHSYLSYLRDRVIAARELLSDSGSIFVQINEENIHLLRSLMDEVFGPANFICQIQVQKTGGATGDFLVRITDYILWYARDKGPAKEKYHQLYLDRGERYLRTDFGSEGQWSADPLTSDGFRDSTTVEFEFQDRTFHPGSNSHWKVTVDGLRRAGRAGRLVVQEKQIRFKKYFDDYPVTPLKPLWDDVGGAVEKRYVVQTSPKVVERCVLMTTAPGDLIVDPTCGSGTTAYVAEHWGRRWITIDTSRVAVAIARQRLMTATFDRFRVKGEAEADLNRNGRGVDPHPGFMYETVPHVTLKSIAQNVALDPIFDRHEPKLDAALAACNAALKAADAALRAKLARKLLAKQRDEGKSSVTDADRRRWDLPPVGEGFKHWSVPFDADPDYPPALAAAVEQYRAAWRAKMDEVNAAIATNAEREELVDRPRKVKGVVRVSGPFTVEAVQPPEMMLGQEPPVAEATFDGAPEQVGPTFSFQPVVVGDSSQDLSAYLDKMIRLLRQCGVRYLTNKRKAFLRLDPIFATREGMGFHAEGRWVAEGEEDPDPEGPANVGVLVGPQYGPVTAKMVQEMIRPAAQRWPDLIVAGFSFDAPAQDIFQNPANPRLRLHMANISPDVNPGMDGLLKNRPDSQLFTVFGQPRVRVDGPDAEGHFVVTMEGVDIYNPVSNDIVPTSAEKVAAWFLDGDYDGKAFCITQAFFPDRGAWDKLAKALKGVVDSDAFAAFGGTTSLPFPAGEQRRCAVKVIDPRGNEVMSVHKLATKPEGRHGK